jgi:selenophosphate synthase
MGEVREGKSLVVVNPVGEGALRQVLKEYGTHYHHERNHQGRGNELLMPLASQEALGTQSIRTRERLGGLLKFYYREAA